MLCTTISHQFVFKSIKIEVILIFLSFSDILRVKVPLFKIPALMLAYLQSDSSSFQFSVPTLENWKFKGLESVELHM
jgi:hypothetical protein